MKLPVKKEHHPSAPDTPSVEILSPDQILEKRATQEISKNEGMEMLTRYVRATFPQQRIASMLDDLCKADDTRSGQYGQYKTPNWMARDKGLERVLRILSLENETGGIKQGPTKMVFNIISNSPVTVEKKED